MKVIDMNLKQMYAICDKSKCDNCPLRIGELYQSCFRDLLIDFDENSDFKRTLRDLFKVAEDKEIDLDKKPLIPMTQKQKEYIEYLCEEYGGEVPQNLSKEEASIWIENKKYEIEHYSFNGF